MNLFDTCWIRLLKLSGRLLQTVSFYYLGPEVRDDNHLLDNGDEPSGMMDSVDGTDTSADRDPYSRRQRPRPRRRSLWRQRPTPASTIVRDGEVRENMERPIAELIGGLPSSARFDAANRYLEV